MDQSRKAIITLDQVSKAYALFDSKLQRARHAIFGGSSSHQTTRNVLSNINVTVHSGEMLGILGLNGAGKSTLLQIITGILLPSTGTVSVDGRIAALLELGAGFNPQWTGRENTRFQLQISGVEEEKLEGLIAEVEKFADIGVYFDQPVRTFSSGMFVRVAFAASIVNAPEILIIDEALAVGDARFQNKCYNKIQELKSAGTTILLVSHSTEAVVTFCDRAIVLENGNVTFDGEAKPATEYYMGLLYGKGTRPQFSSQAEARADEIAIAENGTGDNSGSYVSDEETEAVLQKLRSMQPSELTYFNPDARKVGSGNATIKDVAFLTNGELNPSGIVNTGDDLEVMFNVLAHEDIEAPAFGVTVNTVDGVQLDLSASHLQQVVYSRQPAGELRTYRASWKAALAGGDYFVDIGFSEVKLGTHRTDDWRLGIIQFVVSYTLRFQGPADLSIRFENASLNN